MSLIRYLLASDITKSNPWSEQSQQQEKVNVKSLVTKKREKSRKGRGWRRRPWRFVRCRSPGSTARRCFPHRWKPMSWPQRGHGWRRLQRQRRPCFSETDLRPESWASRHWTHWQRTGCHRAQSSTPWSWWTPPRQPRHDNEEPATAERGQPRGSLPSWLSSSSSFTVGCGRLGRMEKEDARGMGINDLSSFFLT